MQTDAADLEHPATVDDAAGTAQRAVRLDGTGVQVLHALKQDRYWRAGTSSPETRQVLANRYFLS